LTGRRRYWLAVLTLLVLAGALLPAPAAPAAGPQVVISDFSVSPRYIEAGDDFKATVTLENTGDLPANNIRLSINEGAVDSPFAPYLTPGTIAVEGKLEPGEEIQKTFRLGSSSSAVPGINNLFLTIRYQNDRVSVKEYVYTETIGIPIAKTPPAEAARPKLTISRVELRPEAVEAGREFSLLLEVKNFGNQRARAISVVASRLEGANGLDVFFPVGTSNAFALDSLAQEGRAKKTLKFMVSPRAQAKTYNLVIEMAYRDQDGQTYTTSEVIGIPVYKGGKTFLIETGPKLIIRGQRVSRAPVPAGESFDLFLDILNASEFTAKNIRVSLGEDDPDTLKTFSPVKTSNVIFIPELAGKQQVTRNIPLAVSKDAESKRYNLTVKMTCEDTGGNRYESSGMASVLVKGEKEPRWGPELTIVAYSLPSEQIETGSPFRLTLHVRNIGDKPAKNVKAALTNVEGASSLDVFSPLESSNTLYIENLDAGATASRSIKLFVSGEARSKIYNMVVNFSYQGDDGTKHTGTEIIGIPVIEDQSLKIVSFTYPERVTPGEEFDIYAEYINTGKYPVENLFVTFRGDFEVEYPTYYLGKFEAGSTDVFETKATISEPGEYHGRVIFSYTNSYNQERVVTRPVRIVVEEPAEPAFEEAAQPEEKEGFWAKVKRFILALFGLGGGP